MSSPGAGVDVSPQAAGRATSYTARPWALPLLRRARSAIDPRTAWHRSGRIRSGSCAMARAPAMSPATRPSPGALPPIDIAESDVDVPLSPLGEQQADALGDWFAALPARAAADRPQFALLRARETAIDCWMPRRCRHGADAALSGRAAARKGVRHPRPLHAAGIRASFPELAEQRRHVGKFYFRPPGGESWCDVILRLRSFVEMLTREYRR